MVGPQRNFDNCRYLWAPSVCDQEADCGNHGTGYCDPVAPIAKGTSCNIALKGKRSTSFYADRPHGGDGGSRTHAPGSPTCRFSRAVPSTSWVHLHFMLYPCFPSGNREEQQDRTNTSIQFWGSRKPAWLLEFPLNWLPILKHDFESGYTFVT